MNVLLTGARAPSCLDLGKSLALAGHRVEATDCVRFPLTRFSNLWAGYEITASPRFETEAYLRQISEKLAHLDLVVPTCEEVFYLAQLRSRTNDPGLRGKLFCDDFDKILRLHDKRRFAEDSKRWPISAPETHLLSTEDDWRAFEKEREEFVFKPVFSRFAARTLIDPKPAALARARAQGGGDWIAQRRVRGEEICLYAVCNRGKVRAFAAYVPEYRAGLGAGIFLKPVYDPELYEYCVEFARERAFHGQVAFDVIRENDRYYMLECNPRATSGVHFFGPEIAQAFADEDGDVVWGRRDRPRMVAAAMLVYGLPRAPRLDVWRKFVADFRAASDVVWDARDPLPFWGQYLSFAIFVAQSVLRGTSAIALSSRDIEYNG